MKHRLSSLILFFTLFLMISVPAVATDATPATGNPVEMVTDNTYKGVMDIINVRGKDYEPREAVYELRDGKLLCDFPKIGKMPGKIEIELPVSIAENGQLTAEEGTVAGVMKMPMGIRIKLTLMSLRDAVVKGENLSFFLTVSGKFMGADFPTSIHFNGNVFIKE